MVLRGRIRYQLVRPSSHRASDLGMPIPDEEQNERIAQLRTGHTHVPDDRPAVQTR